MQKIIPHFWYDKEAGEAVAFYTSLFKDSEITHTQILKDTPSGDAEFLTFKLAGQEFMAISAGPYFKQNPSISMSVAFDNEDEAKALWDKLIEGGEALMEYDTYPWAAKYGWVKDKYGFTWQISAGDHNELTGKIIPSLMFTQGFAGKAKEAISDYTSIFPDSSTDLLVEYAEGEGDVAGYIKHARFTLAGQPFIAMDSSGPHQFIFNEAISLLVNCDTQEEIDFYWEKLSRVPEAEQCGWLKDKYGVSWQIQPTIMNDMMSKGTPEQIARVTQAFLQMKKFDIKKLEEAFQG